MLSNVGNIVVEAKKLFLDPVENQHFDEIIKKLIFLLPAHDESKSDLVISQAKKEFCREHYETFIIFLLDKLNSEWFAKLPKGQTPLYFDIFFLEGFPHIAYLSLYKVIEKTEPSFKLYKCIKLIEEFLSRHCLQNLLLAQCEAHAAEMYGNIYFNNVSHQCSPFLKDLRSKLITCISSLPDTIIGKMHGEINSIFFPVQYIPFIVSEIVIALDKINSALMGGHDCSISFLGQLIGKLCFVGYAEFLWPPFIKALLQRFNVSHSWSRLSESLLSFVPHNQLESVIVPLLKHAPNAESVVKFLGYSVLENQTLMFLLSNKLLLLRQFREENLLRNAIGYLASSPLTRNLYQQTFISVLTAWSNASSLKHASYEQHLYVSKAVLICIGLMTEEDKQSLNSRLLDLLIPGVKHHLDSSTPSVRKLGMLIGEAITTKIRLENQKLEFEYEKDSEDLDLLKLLQPPNSNNDNSQNSLVSGHLVDSNNDSNNSQNSLVSGHLVDSKQISKDSATLHSEEFIESSQHAIQNELSQKLEAANLDSDDDLEPYDMSHDVKQSKVKMPSYIRDCLEGIISNENQDRVAICLKTAEKLIRSCPSTTVQEVAEEFAKVLLHLENRWAMEDFLTLRHRALLALAVMAPSQVARYLTTEFFARNYNVRQRLDMLEILAGSSQELSSLTFDNSKHSLITVLNPDNTESTQKVPEDWHKIIEKRLEGKTRRFHTKSAKQPSTNPNRFAPYAGDFFFPLLRQADCQEPCIDLLGSDHIILTRLLYTLGIIMYSASNAPVLPKMAKIFFDFIWIIRHHQEAAVRSAVLFAISMLLLVIPSHILMDPLQQEALEVKSWLEDVFQKDLDHNCQKMAAQALYLLQRIVNQENQ